MRAAAAWLGWSVVQLKVAIAAGEVEMTNTCRGNRLPLHEVAALARSRWQLAVIEEALGEDAPAILPPALWTRPVSVRLTRYHIQMLDHFAANEGLPVDAIVARALDEHMYRLDEELADVIEDYHVALNWPEEHDVTPSA